MTTQKRILVLGGTRYFGKQLVKLLLDQGHQVTVATRGKTTDPFGNRIERGTIDRSDLRTIDGLAKTRYWDVVFDQLCYSPNEAELSIEVFKGRVGRYVHTSTASVYNTDGARSEKDFDPTSYPIRNGNRSDFNYSEGKRLAEAMLFQQASFPVVAMRIPIVLGPDDYTGRLEFHIDRVRARKTIVIPNLNASTSFIYSSEAARFLYWLAMGNITGPINACSNGTLSIREIIEIIEHRVGQKAEIVNKGAEEAHTPFTDEKSRYLDNSRARALGFEFENLSNWFPSLVSDIASREFMS